MRYEDGPSVEVDIHIDASPAKVWELVTDINMPARFSTEFKGARWLDGDGPRAGARFAGTNEHPAIGAWETVSFVVHHDAERRFGWAVIDADIPAASWRFDLEPDGDGTRLRQWMRMGPARSGLNVAIDAMPDKEERIIERRLAEHRANMTATLEGIKALAEGR